MGGFTSSGGGAVTSANMPDPYVPVDGTANITGALSVSGQITGGDIESSTGALYFGAPAANTIVLQHVGGAGNGAIIWGGDADGATAVNCVIDGKSTLANAAAKLLSVRNNTVEKAFFDKDGSLTLAGTGAGANILNLPANDYLRFNGNGARIYLGSGFLNLDMPNGGTISLQGRATDGATAVSTIINATDALSTAGAKLLSVQNGGVEKAAISAGGGLSLGGVTAVKTTTYAATLNDFLIPCTVAGGTWVLTLPAASAAKGQILKIKITDLDAAKRVTVTRAGADTIVTDAATGATSFSMGSATTYDAAELISDGTSKWYLTSYMGSVIP